MSEARIGCEACGEECEPTTVFDLSVGARPSDRSLEWRCPRCGGLAVVGIEDGALRSGGVRVVVPGLTVVWSDRGARIGCRARRWSLAALVPGSD